MTESKKKVKRICLGSERRPNIEDRDANPNINPGEVHHLCPFCSRRWARNTSRDWSSLPIPRHYIKVDKPDPRRDGAPPARYSDPRIQFWDDERSSGSGIIVTIHYGFTFDAPWHGGVKGFDSGAEAFDAVKASDHCYCQECSEVIERGHE